jgi:hypothetical protein
MEIPVQKDITNERRGGEVGQKRRMQRERDVAKRARQRKFVYSDSLYQYLALCMVQRIKSLGEVGGGGGGCFLLFVKLGIVSPVARRIIPISPIGLF